MTHSPTPDPTGQTWYSAEGIDGTKITALPDKLTVVGNLDLRNSNVIVLSDDLSVGGGLYLSGSNISELPDNLTVGGNLDLRNSAITELPDNLTVGGDLYLNYAEDQKEEKKVRHLKSGDYVEGRYLYADGILTHVKKKYSFRGYTIYQGKIPGKNVISDGVHYAHCNKLRDGIADLLFKTAEERGAAQYKNITLESRMGVPELVTMYRVITGACRQGSEDFVKSLGDNLKESYTVAEAIELTRGQYNAERFEEFFN